MFNNSYLKEHSVCTFDIETTGLSPDRDMIICAGFYNSRGELIQIFADSPLEERIIIAQILERLSSYDAVISYNGDRFDLPFLLTRAKKYSEVEKLPVFWSIDLYKWLRYYWPAAATMKSLSQKSVEKALRIQSERSDLISGGECIALYNSFLASGDPDAKEKILLHNADDLRQLLRIAEATSFLPYHEIAFNEGFLVKTEDLRIVTKAARMESGHLKLSAITCPGLLPASIYEDGFSLDYDSFSGLIDLEIFISQIDAYRYADLQKLPVSSAKFQELPSFHSSYLVLAENDEIDFKAANILTAEILKTCLKR